MINTKDFLQIAGNTGRWDDLTRTRVECGESLPHVQERHHAAGFRSAEMTRSVYGWYIRSGSGLDGFAVLFQPTERHQLSDRGFAECLRWGKAWVDEDPECREFYIRRSALVEHLEEVSVLIL